MTFVLNRSLWKVFFQLMLHKQMGTPEYFTLLIKTCSKLKKSLRKIDIFIHNVFLTDVNILLFLALLVITFIYIFLLRNEGKLMFFFVVCISNLLLLLCSMQPGVC